MTTPRVTETHRHGASSPPMTIVRPLAPARGKGAQRDSRPSISALRARSRTPGSMISGAVPGRMPVPLRRQAYSPVSSEYREGVQVAEVAYARVKRTPSAASRSSSA